MKAVVISDTHTNHKIIDMPEGDILIHCGDFQGSKPLLDDFLDWFQEQDFKYKILIAGNHDWEIAKLGYTEMYKKAKEKGIEYLENSSVKIEGILFYGAPWSNEYGGWDFMKTDDALYYEWDKIPKETKVLITHGPAYGVGDRVPLSYSSGNNVGSYALNMKIKTLDNLRYHFFGHIHGDSGYYSEEKYEAINASLSYEYYERMKGKSKPPFEIEIN